MKQAVAPFRLRLHSLNPTLTHSLVEPQFNLTELNSTRRQANPLQSQSQSPAPELFAQTRCHSALCSALCSAFLACSGDRVHESTKARKERKSASKTSCDDHYISVASPLHLRCISNCISIPSPSPIFKPHIFILAFVHRGLVLLGAESKAPPIPPHPGNPGNSLFPIQVLPVACPLLID